MHFRKHMLRSDYFDVRLEAREETLNRELTDIEAWNEFLYLYENLPYAGLPDEDEALALAKGKKLFRIGQKQGLYSKLQQYSWNI